MPKQSVKLTLQLPEGLAKEINDIVEKHDLWMSSQDFILTKPLPPNASINKTLLNPLFCFLLAAIVAKIPK